MPPRPPSPPMTTDLDAINYDLISANLARGYNRFYLSGLDPETGTTTMQRDLIKSLAAAEDEIDEETKRTLADYQGMPPPPRPVSAKENVISKKENIKPRLTTSRSTTATARSRHFSGPVPITRPGSSAASNSSRPTSRSSSRPRPASSAAHTRLPSTSDSRAAAAALSQRPVRPLNHTRTKSSTTTVPKPFSFASSRSTQHNEPERGRSTSVTGKIASRNTIGRSRGREVVRKMGEPGETSTEAVKRILRDDKEEEERLEMVAPAIGMEEEDGEIVVGGLEGLMGGAMGLEVDEDFEMPTVL